MKKKRFTEQQIIGFLMEAGAAEAMLASQTPHMKCRLPQHGQAVPCGGLAVRGHQAAPDSSTGWASNHARIRCSLNYRMLTGAMALLMLASPRPCSLLS